MVSQDLGYMQERKLMRSAGHSGMPCGCTLVPGLGAGMLDQSAPAFWWSHCKVWEALMAKEPANSTYLLLPAGTGAGRRGKRPKQSQYR